MSNPLRKVVGLQGPGQMYVPDNQGSEWPFYLDSSDYRIAVASPAYGENATRNVTRNSNSYLKVWVSWFALQEDFVAVNGHQPQSWQESFDYMNIHEGPVWPVDPGQARIRRLDRMIRQANADGVPVILSVIHHFPGWSNTCPVGDYTTRGRTKNEYLPYSVYSDGPWGFFMSYLLCRYKKNTPPNDPVYINDPGPREAQWFGNPEGAWVSAIDVCNEPNWAVWPQGENDSICKTAEMMRTAAYIADAHGWHRTGQYLLGPGVLDRPDPQGEPGAQPWESYYAPATDWEYFTRRVIEILGNWQPLTYFGWSVHNYVDVEAWGSGGGGQESRLKRVQNMLTEYGWKRGTDRNVWITETGFAKGNTNPLAKSCTQNRRCIENINRMRGANYPYVPIWTNHGVLDSPIDRAEGRGMRGGYRLADNKVHANEYYELWTSWLADMPNRRSWNC